MNNILNDFSFVDEILDLEPGRHIRASYSWPTESPLYEAHFPGFPVVPGVLIAEMMQQAGALCLESGYPDYGKAVLLQIRRASFHDWVAPGDRLIVEVAVDQVSRRTSKMRCEVQRDGKLIARSKVASGWAPWHALDVDPVHPLLRRLREGQLFSPEATERSPATLPSGSALQKSDAATSVEGNRQGNPNRNPHSVAEAGAEPSPPAPADNEIWQRHSEELNNSSLSLQRKTILVTGGTRGLGAATSAALLRSGARVIVNYARNKQAAELFVAEHQTSDERLTLVRADISREKGMEALISSTEGLQLNGLVHSAVTGVHKPLAELTLRHWDWTQAVNVRAFFDLIVQLQNRFAESASIVALSSEGAVKADANYATVGASKGALEALCRHLALELRSRRVRVNCVSAGSVVTKAWDAFPDRQEKIAALETRFAGEALLQADEVARVIQFLLSEQATGINGSVLVVDKGERVFP